MQSAVPALKRSKFLLFFPTQLHAMLNYLWGSKDESTLSQQQPQLFAFALLLAFA
jgi:hypothetical protein